MKIAVVGCGAVGCFYGARLCRAGETVHFLLRSDYEVVRRQGVQIRSVDGDFQVRPHCARQAGVPTPRLARLTEVLTHLNPASP